MAERSNSRTRAISAMTWCISARGAANLDPLLAAVLAEESLFEPPVLVVGLSDEGPRGDAAGFLAAARTIAPGRATFLVTDRK